MTGTGEREASIRRVTVDLRGSARAAGRAYGEEFAADIARQVDAYRGVYESVGMDAESVARRCETDVLPATERVFPAYADELRGRAEGAGVPFGQLLALHCVEEVWSWVGPEKLRELEELHAASARGEHCTTFALRRDGRVLLGHNEDWSAVDLDTTMLLHDVTAADGTRFLSLQLVGLLPWGGLNAHGLAITANTLPTTDGRPGVANAFVLRRLLECRTLEEVWEHVCTPERGLGTYVLAADAFGRCWAMETSAGRASLQMIATWTAETNHFTHASMQDLRTQPVSEDTLGRLAHAHELLAAGWARDEELSALARRVLTAHGDDVHPALCVHPAPDLPAWSQDATISAVMYEPAVSRLWATVGHSCGREIELFELD